LKTLYGVFKPYPEGAKPVLFCVVLYTVREGEESVK
jgi:hypothetical protein